MSDTSAPVFTSFVSEVVIHETGNTSAPTTHVRYEDANRLYLVVQDQKGSEIELSPNEALHVSVAIRRLVEGEVFVTEPPKPAAAPEVTPAVAVEQVDFDDPLN